MKNSKNNSILWLMVGALVFFAGVFGSIVYQISHDKTPSLSSVSSTTPDTSAYEPKMRDLTAKLASVGVASTWPSKGSNDVLRLDLPSTNPPFDDHTARSVAPDAYNSFVSAREDSHVPDPANCIVHIYDDTGKQVAHASESGTDN